MNRKKSVSFYRRASGLLPGGVNSPVRAFKAVGLSPIFIESAKGSKVWDVDRNEYIDYVCSWGPMILGHAHPKVIATLKRVLTRGTSFGASTPLEIELALRIKKAFPSIELIRMVNSGTEAVMSAIRLARGYTGKNKIIKFEGCYHGHGDSLLVRTGSGGATFGIPDSLGVPEDLAKHTLCAPYNDLEKVEGLAKQYPGEIACIIVEPIAGNMGVVLPEKGFLEGLRRICDEHGILLIFDEVITGFRVAYGGVQELYGIKADLTCLGKIIGGGLPVGAYGGKEKIMEKVAPLGGVYQAGTLSGNPLAMAAGIETLDTLKSQKVYGELERKTSYLAEGILECAEDRGIPVTLNKATGMLTLFFTDRPVKDFSTAKMSDTKRFAQFFNEMLNQGIYLPPSQFEAWFLSTAHNQKDLDRTIEACEIAFRRI